MKKCLGCATEMVLKMRPWTWLKETEQDHYQSRQHGMGIAHAIGVGAVARADAGPVAVAVVVGTSGPNEESQVIRVPSTIQTQVHQQVQSGSHY